MSDKISLTAELRSDVGKGASRRLRRLDDKVPAIIYGGEEAPQNLTLIANELSKAMQLEAFYSQIMNVVVDGNAQQAFVRDLQRNPASGRVLHIDFQRVSADRAINVNVPLHFINEGQCVGVKLAVARSPTASTRWKYRACQEICPSSSKLIWKMSRPVTLCISAT